MRHQSWANGVKRGQLYSNYEGSDSCLKQLDLDRSQFGWEYSFSRSSIRQRSFSQMEPCKKAKLVCAAIQICCMPTFAREFESNKVVLQSQFLARKNRVSNKTIVDKKYKGQKYQRCCYSFELLVAHSLLHIYMTQQSYHTCYCYLIIR